MHTTYPFKSLLPVALAQVRDLNVPRQERTTVQNNYTLGLGLQRLVSGYQRKNELHQSISGLGGDLRQPSMQLLLGSSLVKQNKQSLIRQVRTLGYTVNNVLVTRRPQDFMFSQAAYTQSGFCQGFVTSVFEQECVFDSSLDAFEMARRAQDVQNHFERSCRNNSIEEKEKFYSQRGSKLGPIVLYNTPRELAQHLKIKSDVPYEDRDGQTNIVYYDIHLSGGDHGDHVAGIAIKHHVDGTVSAAVIDADRGFRRTVKAPDLTYFFDDLERQSDGSKTKSGYNRKFHSWQNRVMVIRQVRLGSERPTIE